MDHKCSVNDSGSVDLSHRVGTPTHNAIIYNWSIEPELHVIPT